MRKIVLALRGATVVNDVKVERIYKDAVDLLLSIKLGKMTKRVVLEEVISRIGEKTIDYMDTTMIVREMREKKYDY